MMFNTAPSHYVYHMHLFTFYHARPIIFEKTIIKYYIYEMEMYVGLNRDSNTGLWLDKSDATSSWLFGIATTFLEYIVKQ